MNNLSTPLPRCLVGLCLTLASALSSVHGAPYAGTGAQKIAPGTSFTFTGPNGTPDHLSILQGTLDSVNANSSSSENVSPADLTLARNNHQALVAYTYAYGQNNDFFGIGTGWSFHFQTQIGADDSSGYNSPIFSGMTCYTEDSQYTTYSDNYGTTSYPGSSPYSSDGCTYIGYDQGEVTYPAYANPSPVLADAVTNTIPPLPTQSNDISNYNPYPTVVYYENPWPLTHPQNILKPYVGIARSEYYYASPPPPFAIEGNITSGGSDNNGSSPDTVVPDPGYQVVLSSNITQTISVNTPSGTYQMVRICPKCMGEAEAYYNIYDGNNYSRNLLLYSPGKTIFAIYDPTAQILYFAGDNDPSVFVYDPNNKLIYQGTGAATDNGVVAIPNISSISGISQTGAWEQTVNHDGNTAGEPQYYGFATSPELVPVPPVPTGTISAVSTRLNPDQTAAVHWTVTNGG